MKATTCWYLRKTLTCASPPGLQPAPIASRFPQTYSPSPQSNTPASRPALFPQIKARPRSRSLTLRFISKLLSPTAPDRQRERLNLLPPEEKSLAFGPAQCYKRAHQKFAKRLTFHGLPPPQLAGSAKSVNISAE